MRSFVVTEIRPPKKICKVLQDKCKHQCTPEVSHSFKLILLPSIAERLHNGGHCLLHYKVSKRQSLPSCWLLLLVLFQGLWNGWVRCLNKRKRKFSFPGESKEILHAGEGACWEPGKAAPYSAFVCLQMKNRKSWQKKRLAEIIFVCFPFSIKYWFAISTR